MAMKPRPVVRGAAAQRFTPSKPAAARPLMPVAKRVARPAGLPPSAPAPRPVAPRPVAAKPAAKPTSKPYLPARKPIVNSSTMSQTDKTNNYVEAKRQRNQQAEAVKANKLATSKKADAKKTASAAFKPVVSGASKNVGERYSFQQTANGNRYQKAPVNKAKGLTGQLVTSTSAERKSLKSRSRMNALAKAMKKK